MIDNLPPDNHVIVEAEESQHDRREDEAAWGEVASSEARWPAMIAIFIAIGLSIMLPRELTVIPQWLMPALEGAVALPLLIASPRRYNRESGLVRSVSMCLIAMINIANFISLGALIYHLTHGFTGLTVNNEGLVLLEGSIPIWLTNIIVFALWFWELDRGGPAARLSPKHRQPDFLFPQMNAVATNSKPWYPVFVDYLYTSITNATAFSPTDTMPLTSWAKMLMAFQSIASLLTVVLLTARAVNIL